MSEEYKNAKTDMLWCCKYNHQWTAKFKNIREGRWCHVCAINGRKYNLLDCQRVAHEKGGKCLSEEYKDAKTKLKWECSAQHKWTATLDDIKNGGTWCPHCYGNVRHSINDCIRLAKLKGGKCLSAEYINAYTPLLWQCGEKHQWNADFSHIKNHNQWCPYCGGKIRLTIEECQEFAESKNGKCLSDEYINIRTDMIWQCEANHIWKAPFRAIKNNGSWCPKCVYNATQKKLSDIIEDMFIDTNVETNYRSFEWLKNKRRLEIDIWAPGIKLAIEYDGEQHFIPIDWPGMGVDWAEEKLKKIQKYDRLKNKLIAQHPEDIKYFIRIPYTEKITEKNVAEILKKNGVKLPSKKGKIQ